jgi:hypothetical protein
MVVLSINYLNIVVVHNIDCSVNIRQLTIGVRERKRKGHAKRKKREKNKARQLRQKCPILEHTVENVQSSPTEQMSHVTYITTNIKRYAILTVQTRPNKTPGRARSHEHMQIFKYPKP